MSEKWHLRFLEVAKLVATWSKDPSTQTGCVVVDKDRNLVAGGFNGFPRGVHDHADRYQDRAIKYRLICHCDTNSIYSCAKRGVAMDGCTMYLTGPACNECMKGIIQAGIIRVVWPEDNPFEKNPELHDRWWDSMQASALMANEAGIELVRV